MPALKCILSGIVSTDQFYDEIERQLQLPPHFGRNLDALWDALTGDVPGPVEIVWEASAESSARMGENYERLAALLQEVADERDDFGFVAR